MLIGIVVVESILFEIRDIPVFMGNLFDPTIRYASIYIDINNQIVLLIGVARLSEGQIKFSCQRVWIDFPCAALISSTI